MVRKVMFIFSLALIFQSVAGIAAQDGLDTVNRQRASKGLKPFIRDEAMSQGAAKIADYRAANLISGHVRGNRGDFAFLPPGARATAGGAGAWPMDIVNILHWGTCCSDENWTYAGAASAMGRDGKLYMHLFVSNSPNAMPSSSYSSQDAEPFSWMKVKGGWWLMQGSTYAGYLHEDRHFQWRNADGSFTQHQRLEGGQIPVKK
jgi:hypothetical protein